jgi:hypothetical protein
LAGGVILKNLEAALAHASRLFLQHVLTLCMFVHFYLIQKNLAANAACNLSNLYPGFHHDY